MTERIGIYGVSAEMLALLPSLIAHPDLEIVRIYTGRARALLARLPDLDPELAAALVDLLSDRPESVSSDRSLSAIIEATHGLDPKVHSRDAGGDGPRVLSPSQARQLWGGPTPSREARRFEIRGALQSIYDSEDDLGRQLAAICRLAATRAGDCVVQLYRLDAAAGCLRLAATSLPGEITGGADLRIPLGEGIEGEVARRRSALRMQGATGGWLWCLPLRARAEIAGVLSLQAGAGSRWDPTREAPLTELAEAVGTALLRAEAEQRRAQRSRNFENLANVSLRMISSRDVGELLRLGASEAARTLGADHAVLRLVDWRTQQLVVRSYSGSAEGSLQEALFRLDRSLAGELLDRNAPRRIERITADPALRAHSEVAQSAIATPLRRGEIPVGTLALYDKLDPERLEPVPFHAQDLELLERFARHLERALANARLRARARSQGELDEETELPQQDYLERRVREELARSAASATSFSLLSVRIENLEALRRGPEPLVALRCTTRLAESLRSRIRDFDVLARSARDEFVLLLPEPGRVPEDRILDLARAVAEDVAKPGRIEAAPRAELAFGYASHPADGADWESLMARAREPRIRNL
ncbi:MAG: GAF domain-containing protein [Myxococcales bacterium]|nr:GAF domain-containing protein [Myxococcales bacterium]